MYITTHRYEPAHSLN